MDHGILNVPLSKRGNIDSQLDAWKAQQARQAKADRKARAEQTRADRAAAKARLAAMPEAQIMDLAQRFELTPAQARKRLNSIAYYTPGVILKLAVAEAEVQA